MCCPSKIPSLGITYPAELEIKDTNDADHRASYLDLDLSYDRDKRL